MTRVLAKAAYGLWVAAFVVAGLELLFRIVASDPFYYWQYRFQFVSPNSYENREDGVWTYRPNAAVRDVAVFGMPSPLSSKPALIVEFDCRMRSNNLGLLQDNDVAPGTPQTIVFGDSFTSGQGGCPWFHKLQARRPQDQLVNAGLLGTGFRQWQRLLQYLGNQGVLARRVLIISISDDFKRRAWNWTDAELNCINYSICAPDRPYSRQAVSANETHEELIARTRERYAQRFGGYNALGFWFASLEPYSMLLKHIHIAVENLAGVMKPGKSAILPETGSALEAFKALHVPVKVLMVTQRNEAGMLGNEVDAAAAVAALDEYGISYDWCRLHHDDFLPLDGHPSSAGYEKLVECVDRALGVN